MLVTGALQMCTDGVGCKRRVCFFAHAEAELRKPEEDPVWLQQQMQSEMQAGGLVRRAVMSWEAPRRTPVAMLYQQTTVVRPAALS